MGQDYSFEWFWRYTDAMIIWSIIMGRVIVTQMSQNVIIISPLLSVY
jgi:endo-beta-N-acetylglucosaminidase D